MAGTMMAAMGGLVACAGTPGAHPHDMSVAQHEAMAEREEGAAAAHEARFDPTAEEERTKCSTSGGRVGRRICWTSAVNPTKEHLRDAETHLRRAAEHRAAGQALQDAEARACVGVAPEDRDMSPFYHRDDIARVEPLAQDTPANRATGTPVVKGATVVLRAVPGLTVEWLQRTVDCHLARNAAMGHTSSDMAYCPLVMKDVTATVTSTGDGFTMALRSDDPDVAAEILRRAQALVAR